MQFTPLCHTDFIRADLELWETGNLQSSFRSELGFSEEQWQQYISFTLITITDGFGWTVLKLKMLSTTEGVLFSERTCEEDPGTGD